ncbi:MAG: hypothetical protein P4L81_00365 [Candidatus Pacebacteria bacterium]|nr:hypothetical protein [Candidatus Paceibacterota bacterium]
MPRYKVKVNDNFHYMDSNYCYEQGMYETVKDAIAACREIVDQSLEELQPLVSAEELYRIYVSFGDDPFIEVLDGTDASAKFSAWDYAKQRSRVIIERLGAPNPD